MLKLMSSPYLFLGTSYFRIIRPISDVARKKPVHSNEFGAINQSEIRIERLEKPKLRRAVGDDVIPSTKSIKSISSPVGMSRKRMDALRAKQEFDHSIRDTKKVIECSRREFDQYEGMKFPPGVRIPLCSEFWEKNQYKNQWFTIRRRNKTTSRFPSSRDHTWDDFTPDKVHLDVAASLNRMGFNGPVGVQAQCLQSFPSRNHLFIAAETGSGKTLAYAVPLLSEMLRERTKEKSTSKAVIVLATGCLKEQTFGVIRNLADGTGLRVKMCQKTKGDSEKSNDDWDIAVGTPGLIEGSLRQLPNPSDVTQMIFDEADMLLDESFADVLTEIFSIVPVANSITNTMDKTKGARVVFCSASCPEELECLAEAVVQRTNLSYITSRRLHALLPAVEMQFIRILERDKISRLVNMLQADEKKGDRNQTMVFCKDRKTANFVKEELAAASLQPLLWTGDVTNDDVDKTRVIVATDVAARGVDLPRLSHVINYDMARHTVDFLHRCGRVGRVGSHFPSRVTSFVRTTSDVRLTNVIELAARLGKPLTTIETDVAASIRRRREENKEGNED